MLENIKMIKTSYVKKEGTKTVWQEVKEENKLISEEQYNNIIEAKRFFQNLGGYEKHNKSYTCKGYKITEIISISPNKQKKSIYRFEF
jgi:hypothetical protein